MVIFDRLGEFAAARLPPGDADEDVVMAGSATGKPAHEVLGVIGAELGVR